MHTFSKAFNSQFQLNGIYTNFNQLENSDSEPLSLSELPDVFLY